MPTSSNSAEPLRTDIATYLSEQVRGLDVLDVGCVDHDATREQDDRWLHKRLAATAASIIGVDIEEAACQRLRERGYSMVAGDACTVDLGREFDAIVAGEIIEHVENPGQMIRNLARHLRSGGRLHVTTPNAYYAVHIVEALLMDPRKRWNPQHVAWFDPFTLTNLLERAGCRVTSCRYFSRSRKLRRLGDYGLPMMGWMASSLLITAQKARH